VVAVGLCFVIARLLLARHGAPPVGRIVSVTRLTP
jgi:hypothetical protein